MTTFGSVCSGIEAASVAWNPLDWEAAWFAEIEPFPCRLLAHHYPTVPNLGDMTTIADKILAGTIPAPDILCGGTPCQAFSVAGLRNSMGDIRGQLSLEFVRIADAIDTVRPGRPCTVFWENVPGVLSTKDNAFGCFLGALAGEDEPLSPPGGRWTHAGCVSGPTRTIAWRIMDAQYFGLAQRRKRVFVVASAGGINPIQVLFESEGVRRDSAPSRKAGQGFAATFEVGPGGGRESGVNPTLDCRCKNGAMQNQVASVIAFHQTQDPISSTDGTTHGIGCGSSKGAASIAVAFGVGGNDVGHCQRSEPSKADKPDSGTYAVCSDLSPTVLNGAPFSRTGNERVECEAVVAYGGFDPLCADTVTSKWAKGSGGPAGDECGMFVASAMQVRRLTPTECERLQGFPDGYTNIPKAADGPRYKALGNSWAVPVVRWIGQRIKEQLT